MAIQGDEICATHKSENEWHFIASGQIDFAGKTDKFSNQPWLKLPFSCLTFVIILTTQISSIHSRGRTFTIQKGALQATADFLHLKYIEHIAEEAW